MAENSSALKLEAEQIGALILNVGEAGTPKRGQGVLAPNSRFVYSGN